jgi:hypothetical protein
MNILFNFNPADVNRPSFFEMFLETQMMPSLKPALKYIFSVRQWDKKCSLSSSEFNCAQFLYFPSGHGSACTLA